MVDWIKQHPYLTGGLVLGIILLFVLLRKGSASSATAQQVSSGPSDSVAVAGLQANAQIQALNYQAQTQIAGYNAAVNAAALDAAAKQNIADTQTQGAVQVGLAQSNNQVAIASIAAGGITPFSVNGPGSNATPAPAPAGTVVGHAQVQADNAAAAVQQTSAIQKFGAVLGQVLQTGGAAPSNPGATNLNPKDFSSAVDYGIAATGGGLQGASSTDTSYDPARYQQLINAQTAYEAAVNPEEPAPIPAAYFAQGGPVYNTSYTSPYYNKVGPQYAGT